MNVPTALLELQASQSIEKRIHRTNPCSFKYGKLCCHRLTGIPVQSKIYYVASIWHPIRSLVFIIY